MGNNPTREEYENSQVTNTIDEVQILNGHTDITRYLIQIDNLRIASGSDDGKIIIWNSFTGEKLYTLKGHTSPITCMLTISVNESMQKVKERKLLVTGSSDKTVRIWDIYSGHCLHVLTSHKGSVTCLVNMTMSIFCSSGNDSQIIFWNYDATIIGKIERNEEENLHCLICISHNRIVTGSNSTLLFVYNSKEFTFERCLSFHKDSVRCLLNIDEKSFASGSIDGSIAIWSAETLTPIRILHNPEKYFTGNLKTYLYNVSKLTLLPNRFLAAAIGNGYKIFNMDNGVCILNCPKAHNGSVTGVISLYHTSRIVTSSSDNSIKIWGYGPISHPSISNNPKDHLHMKKSASSAKQQEITPQCLGEMWVHSESVNEILSLSEFEFASCGSDGYIVLWKDGKLQSELRNNYASEAMQNKSKINEELYYSDDTESVDSFSSNSNIYNSNEILPSSDIQMPRGSSSSSVAKRTVSGKEFPSAPVPFSSKPPHLPEYIVEYALYLRNEKKATIVEICEELKKQGHSDVIVTAINKKLNKPLVNISNPNINK